MQVLVHELALIVEVGKAERDLTSPRYDLLVRKMSACHLAGNHHIAILDPLLRCRDEREGGNACQLSATYLDTKS